MLKVDISVNDKRFLDEGFDVRLWCRKVIKAAWLEVEDGDTEISLLLTDDEEIAELNSKYRSKNVPTNVISFASIDSDVPEDGVFFAGDIIISYDAIKREAMSLNFKDYLAHLLVHGAMHLAGYDHMQDTEACEMEDIETQILAKLKIKSPYL